MWPFKKREPEPPKPPEPETWEIRVRFKSSFVQCLICPDQQTAVTHARQAALALASGPTMLQIGWFACRADEVLTIIPCPETERNPKIYALTRVNAVHDFARAIEHGDQEHKEWLRRCVLDYAQGKKIRIEGEDDAEEPRAT